MSQSNLVALVAGASGITGANLIEHLVKDGRFKTVYGLARSEPKQNKFPSTLKCVSVDLHERDQCEQKLSELSSEVTHIFYLAWVKRDTEKEQEDYNHQMFKNLMEVVEPRAKNLTQVVLQNGTKYYGCHLGPFPVPAKEDQGRHSGPNFYFRNEDWLIQNSKGKQWKWLETRPSTIIGFSDQAQMNLGTSIAVYASIQRELNQKFEFMGKGGTWNTTNDVTDLDLLSRFTLWAIFDEKARNNQAFNVVNGDRIQWRSLWPKLGSFLGFKKDDIGTKPRDMEKEMNQDKQQLWRNLAKKYQLKNDDLNKLGTWWFVNAELGREWDVYSSMDKARSFGWKETVDTEQMFCDLFLKLSREKIIPPFKSSTHP